MLGFLLIVLFIGLFWLFWSLNANGGTREGGYKDPGDSGHIPGFVDENLTPYADSHHSTDAGDSTSHDSGSADGGGDSGH